MSIRSAALGGLLLPLAAGLAAAEPLVLPEIAVTATRLDEGVSGAATTIITAEEITRSPAQTLPELLARQPGVQLQSMFGGVAGARDSVDMRGFGAAAVSNTLVLLNGRRLTDIDLSGVDFAAIPLESIERIEIVRGNAGAVLYGDAAVGGAINIVTKTGVGLPPSYRAEVGIGSWGYREANASVRQPAGDFVASLHGGIITSDGWRANNDLRQRNVSGELRHSTARGDLYLHLSADDQELGLPGPRRVNPGFGVNELVTDPRGADTPFDRADKQGLNATLGGTHHFNDALELVVDAGVRWKAQQSAFFSNWGPAFDSYADSRMTTLSLTPRLNARHDLGGLPARGVFGVDLYQTFYDSDRSLREGLAPHTVYDVNQRSVALYGQETINVRPDTEIAAGVRLQHTTVSASERIDVTAPGGAFLTPGQALDDKQWNYAVHLGADHHLTPGLTVFGRVGRSFRLPNVDERVGEAPWGTPVTFRLHTQTSHDTEAGLRGAAGPVDWQLSGYVMWLRNEIHYSTDTWTNVNLDPTRRWGIEASAGWQVLDILRLRGSVAHTRATFRSGPFAGNDVPLVSRWTAAAGVTWDVVGPWLVFDADARYVGARRFDNDQANFQPLMPSHTIVDLRVGGAVEWARWSLAVHNLLDESYFDYGIASAFTPGVYNAYPMPGRTFVGRLGVAF